MSRKFVTLAITPEERARITAEGKAYVKRMRERRERLAALGYPRRRKKNDETR